MSKKKKEQKNKKALIISCIMIGALLIIGLGGFFGYKYYEKTNTVGTNWGDTYYEYIKESKTNKDIKIENNSTLEFIDVPDIEEPVMISNYQLKDSKYANIYYINDKEVKNVIALEPTTVEMLYSMEEKKYNWYVHTENDREAKYVPISKIINEKDKGKEYTVPKQEDIVQNTVDGGTITMTQFDSLFIKPEVEVKTIEYKEDLEEKKLKQALKDTIKEYKTEETLEKEVKEEVEKKEEEITKTKEKMKQAEEAIKQKEEEDRKRREEEAKKGFKVGNRYVKYGTYRGEFFGDETDAKLIFRNDGTAELKLTGKPSMAATYKTGSRNYSQTEKPDYRECIIFTTSDGDYDYIPVDDNTLSDGGIFSFIYVGE